MALTVPLAHDFYCPWCWVALHQVRRLREEFPVTIEWVGYELYPEDMEWPDGVPGDPPPANKPPVPTRFDFICAADGVTVPPNVPKPPKMRTFRTHRAVEHVRATGGDADRFIEDLYEAYYRRGTDINDLANLREIAAPYCDDLDAMAAAIERRDYSDRIVPFDDPAYERGVYNVPTYFIGDERLAERPYVEVAAAIRRALGIGNGLYEEPNFPPAPADRPYVFSNMVQTIDGKILPGGRDETAAGLGSSVDGDALGTLEGHADAVLVGARTLRATGNGWNPGTEWRIVITGSGDVDPASNFLSKGRAVVASPGAAHGPGERMDSDDLPGMLRSLREKGVERILLLGGAEINARFFREGLVDEIFVTIAPKLRLGEDVPTYADGVAFDRPEDWSLVSDRRVGDELFLRYRRKAR